MKRSLSFVIAASVAVAGAAAFGVRGDGVVVESVRPVKGFTEISISAVEDLVVEYGREFKVVVSMDRNLQDYYESRVSGGTLRLGFKPGTSVNGLTMLKVVVTMPKLEGIESSGASTITVGKGFSGASFAASLSGTGRLSGSFEYDRLSFETSGNGAFEVSGKASRVAVAISGAGSFSGRSLAAVDAKVEISGTGNVELAVSGSLDASISGMGTVTYFGAPTVKQSISGLGRVIKG